MHSLEPPDARVAWTDVRVRSTFDLLRSFGAIVLAGVDEDGALIDANRGFRELIGLDGGSADRTEVRAAFVAPSFEELRHTAAGPDGVVFDGIVTLVDGAGRSASVTGTVFRAGRALVLVAEHDVRDHQRAFEGVLALNVDLEEAQRALVQAERALRRREAELRELVATDELTRLLNRRGFFDRVTSETERAIRTGTPLAVIAADVDDFKAVNDRFGHHVGDDVLRRIADCIRAALRRYDVAARTGGDEFLMLLPDTTLEAATTVARRLLSDVQAHVEGVEGKVTISLGVVSHGADEPADALLQRADRALYTSKRAGRGRVTAGPL